MSDNQKKIIPKLKKKLIGFLSDESGKITKEDVLKMGMIAMGIGESMTNGVQAGGSTHSSSGSINICVGQYNNANFPEAPCVDTGWGYCHGNNYNVGHANAGTWYRGPIQAQVTLNNIANGHVNVLGSIISSSKHGSAYVHSNYTREDPPAPSPWGGIDFFGNNSSSPFNNNN